MYCDKCREKIRKENNEKVWVAEFVQMSVNEYKGLLKDFGLTQVNQMIEVLDNYIGEKPKDPYRSHARAIRMWVVEKIGARKLKVEIKETEAAIWQRTNGSWVPVAIKDHEAYAKGLREHRKVEESKAKEFVDKLADAWSVTTKKKREEVKKFTPLKGSHLNILRDKDFQENKEKFEQEAREAYKSMP